MPKGPEPSQVNDLLARREFPQAFPLAVAWTESAPRSAAAWFARARGAFGIGRLRAAHEALDQSVRLGASGPDVNLLRAIIDHRLGRSDAAIAALQTLLQQRAPNAVDAVVALAEALHRANRREELDELITRGGEWLQDPRAAIFSARVTARTDRVGAIDRLESIARADGPAVLRRIAGFDAVRLLDGDGQYQRAFDLATFLHASTGAPFDVQGLLDDAQAQLDLVMRGRRGFDSPIPPQQGSLLVVGVPRSGTTLLEQMLDRHPAISGIGENDGLPAIGGELMGLVCGPRGLINFRVRMRIDCARATSRALRSLDAQAHRGPSTSR